MWWYNDGWWWWWLAFLIIFFVVPLAYGWGYRGWGPWYRRQPRTPARTDAPLPAGQHASEADDFGWGWAAIMLWIVLLIAFLWIVGVFAWPR
jgi:hypothetical protein